MKEPLGFEYGKTCQETFVYATTCDGPGNEREWVHLSTAVKKIEFCLVWGQQGQLIVSRSQGLEDWIRSLLNAP